MVADFFNSWYTNEEDKFLMFMIQMKNGVPSFLFLNTGSAHLYSNTFIFQKND